MVSLTRRLAKEAGRLLKEKGLTLSIAESCTGGLLGYMMTTVPGSSAYFLGGVIAYDDKIKKKLLGISGETLKTHGAVSRECAVDMARGVRRKTGSDIGVSITGIAGPQGGSRTKPVGTVYIALSDAKRTVVKKFLFHGGRDAVRKSSAEEALSLLTVCLEAKGG